LLQHESTRGKVPRNFCLLGAERLIVANQESSSLAIFARAPKEGTLTFLGSVDTPERPFWVGSTESV
jgi:6-phosphogluconolactonase (cycloisomerase 2 family)